MFGKKGMFFIRVLAATEIGLRFYILINLSVC